MGEAEFEREGSVVTVVLDGQPQSAVDLEDPARLHFEYVQHLALCIDTLAPAGTLRVTHVGGAGLTLARWVQQTRPSSPQVVLEPDTALTEAVRREMPLPRGHRIRVRPVDGLAGMAALRDASADVVVVDAYAAGRVPPELSTVEWFVDVGRVLVPGGLLVANVADEPGMRYAARVVAGEALPPIEHGFTHFRLTLHPQRVAVRAWPARAEAPGLAWLTRADALDAALPAPIRKLLRTL